MLARQSRLELEDRMTRDSYRRRVYSCDSDFYNLFEKRKDSIKNKWMKIYKKGFNEFIQALLVEEGVPFITIEKSTSKTTSWFYHFKDSIALTTKVFNRADAVTFIHELAHAVHTYCYEDSAGAHNGTYFAVYSKMLQKYLNFDAMEILKIAEKRRVEYFLDLDMEEIYFDDFEEAIQYVLEGQGMNLKSAYRRKSTVRSNGSEIANVYYAKNNFKAVSLIRNIKEGSCRVSYRNLFPFELPDNKLKSKKKNWKDSVSDFTKVILVSPLSYLDYHDNPTRSEYYKENRGFLYTQYSEETNSYSYYSYIESYVSSISIYDYTLCHLLIETENERKTFIKSHKEKGFKVISCTSMNDYNNKRNELNKAIENQVKEEEKIAANK